MKITLIKGADPGFSKLANLIGNHERFGISLVTGIDEANIQTLLDSQSDATVIDLTSPSKHAMDVLQKIKSSGYAGRLYILSDSKDQEFLTACNSLTVSGLFNSEQRVDACFQRLQDMLPPVPQNEVRRLDTLSRLNLANTPNQREFDDISSLAKNITNSPISLVTVVDKDCQWFLSRHGLDLSQTSRSISFCAHAIVGSELLEIKDTMSDWRFKDNPLVVGKPNIRYYAGVPLILDSGEAIGTLCVLDVVAKELSSIQKTALRTLARSVVNEIELIRKIAKLHQALERSITLESQLTAPPALDPLTHLPNRSTLVDRLNQQLLTTKRYPKKVAVLLINLDHFSVINNTLGSTAGDDAIAQVASHLKSHLRASDTLARLGFDEFAAVIPDIHSADDALLVSKKMLKAINQTANLNGHHYLIKGSIGISLFPDHGNETETLIQQSHLAVQYAKESGGNCCKLYSEDLGRDSKDLLILETNLLEAIARNEIVAFYQPKIDLISGALTGVESLARWQHPKLGLIDPDQFIPLAESRGHIQGIGKHMLHLALTQILKWDADGLAVPKIAVNVSPLELREGFSSHIINTLAHLNVSPSRLELEITESMLTPNNRNTIDSLKTLRDAGVTISIDDFGSGYSSFGQIRRMPVDAIKIDRSFIKDLGGNESSTEIVRAISTMAQCLNLGTIAEGVENSEQILILKQIGCKEIQGNLITPPISPPNFEKWAMGHLPFTFS